MEGIKRDFFRYIQRQTYIELSDKAKGSISKSDLIYWCKELNIDISGLDTSLMIKDKMLENGVSYLDFYDRFKDKAYGIHPSSVNKKFRVNNYQIKKMIETGFLKIAYFKSEYIDVGISKRVQFLNSEIYFNIKQKDIYMWRAININNCKKG